MTKPDSKIPDYTNSAVNLCNPPDIGVKLAELAIHQADVVMYEGELKENDNWVSLKTSEQAISDTKAQIKAMIDALGSYQDLKAGHYAVKYRRVTQEYHAEKFVGNPFDQYRPAVIMEAINIGALNGLIKGKLLTDTNLKLLGVITEKENFAIIIKVE
jgi:hypothetical protein